MLTDTIAPAAQPSDGDYWSHMDRVSNFKKKEHQHKLDPQEQAMMEAYEGLDFEQTESELYRTHYKQETRETRIIRNLVSWATYTAIGVCTGTCAFLSAIGVTALSGLRYEKMVLPLVAHGNVFIGYLVNIFFAVGYVAVAAYCVVWVEPAAAGSGIPEAKAYLNGVKASSIAVPR